MAKAGSHDKNPTSREVEPDRSQVLVLTPEEQLAFWNALAAPPSLTPAQKKLGAVMRGDV